MTERPEVIRRMSCVTRSGISLDEKLLAQFDRVCARKGYTSRSEAIRDLIRDTLVREQWDLGTEEAVGTLRHRRSSEA